MLNTPRVLGEPTKFDFTKLTDILEMLGALQYAYAKGEMSTETVRVLADLANKAGNLIVRSKAADAELDLLVELINQRPSIGDSVLEMADA